MSHWNNIQQVVVVGLGVTGLSVVKHLQKLDLNLSIKVIDTRLHPPGVDELNQDIPLHSGSWNNNWLLSADLVVTNPGIALSTTEIQAVIAKGIPVVGDIELFAWATDAPVVAITGSNGKSTVTDLTGEMLKAAGMKVGVGGNIGVPALELLNDPADIYVLELSSFQLETTSSLSVKVAAFLNLSEDHMDRYDDMESYRQAKLRIFRHAESLVVNREDMATYPDSDCCHDMTHGDVAPKGNLVTFGNDASEFGFTLIDGVEYLSFSEQLILPTSQLKLVGKHNFTNVLTVLALLHCLDVNCLPLLGTLTSYNGLTHRCQVVEDKSGVKWVNDSKATNVASTLAALSGLQLSGTLHLLVGGKGKGADFSELRPALERLNVKLYCYGEDGEEFMTLHPSATRWKDIEEIIKSLAESVSAGDLVMLSPACASFDQFSNFMARGDAFTALAKKFA
ncbi:UDP-N-acetylmuramoyl-L-alanine--D-glutamate ligase [Vibrio sp. 99-8-1]|uniref:UDP-N-acetylmuramoyl-L-alanine--D-glutamate ligase n=1 Tax=Vibrio sp. 99-8-1 TaxID=2607602 RepID=UPI0014938032|nr:UDP-N-acetylmuramoyl-L-alanine--D-glutamate ligase [Vibrio sp. 99-8-1]NOI66132.1 UDP-N-acetylmuramoyl-L-alanine--D-glutamate ligase [Vibrio sp. 99-8-1]